MRPFFVGSFLVLHGIAHSTVGFLADGPNGLVRSDTPARVFLASCLFAVALTGFVQAGLGSWGVPGLRRIWRPLVRASVLGSVVCLACFVAPSLKLVVGLFLDAVALVLSDVALVAPLDAERRPLR